MAWKTVLKIDLVLPSAHLKKVLFIFDDLILIILLTVCCKKLIHSFILFDGCISRDLFFLFTVNINSRSHCLKNIHLLIIYFKYHIIHLLSRYFCFLVYLNSCSTFIFHILGITLLSYFSCFEVHLFFLNTSDFNDFRLSSCHNILVIKGIWYFSIDKTVDVQDMKYFNQ